METLAEAFLNPEDTAGPDDVDDRTEQTSEAGPAAGPAAGTASGFKRNVLKRGIFKAANMQDKLLEKLLSQVIPADDSTGGILDASGPDDGLSAYAARPGFTIATMSANFRRFNGRIGVVFKFQVRVVRLLSWRRPTHTLSLLAVYTFLCLEPYLLFVLPLLLILVCVLIPSFIARHPAPASSTSEEFLRDMDYRPRGPPLAPAVTVKPVKELSRDFFKNLGHLQNSMEDFSVLHDKIVSFAEPKTNFSDEALSSAIFVLLCGLAVFMSLTAHLLPWRYLALVAGWVAICSNHPVASRLFSSSSSSSSTTTPPKAGVTPDPSRPVTTILQPKDFVSSQTSRLASLWNTFVSQDIILDSAPETREVEIFELQRLSLSGTGEWEPWVFSPSPYDPLSPPRISGQRAPGTRFFEDVRPPPGWEWSEKKWALDLWSREWVEERIITGVEVETEGERWVYDIYDEHEGLTGVLDTPLGGGRSAGQKVGLSWEEGEEGMGRRGEWRRRRWVRLVKRKKVG